MQTSTLKSGSRLWFRVAIVAYILICLLTDFLPRYGQPFFRYSGSDPDRAVWNFGWPMAWFIYDSKFGFQVGQFAFIVILLQLIVLAASVILFAVVQRMGKRAALQPPVDARPGN